MSSSTKNPNIRYVYQGKHGLDAIAEHIGIHASTLRNRINVQGLSLTQAIAQGKPTGRGRQSSNESGLVFIKRKSKRRNITMPDFSDLQKLAFGLSMHSDAVTL